MSCSWVVLLACVVVQLMSTVLVRERSVFKAWVPLTEEWFERALMWVTVAWEVVTAVMYAITDNFLKTVTRLTVWMILVTPVVMLLGEHYKLDLSTSWCES